MEKKLITFQTTNISDLKNVRIKLNFPELPYDYKWSFLTVKNIINKITIEKYKYINDIQKNLLEKSIIDGGYLSINMDRYQNDAIGELIPNTDYYINFISQSELELNKLCSKLYGDKQLIIINVEIKLGSCFIYQKDNKKKLSDNIFDVVDAHNIICEIVLI
jgi:hypothetical protein